MAWPSISDYQEAIQNPRVSLADPELRQGTTVCNRLGLPMPITGGFASVGSRNRPFIATASQPTPSISSNSQIECSAAGRRGNRAKSIPT